MSRRQILERIRGHLIARRWMDDPDGDQSAEPVFSPDSVIPTQGPRESELPRLYRRLPSCLLSLGAANPDPEAGEERRYLQSTFTATLICKEYGDRFGTASLIGGHRQSKIQGDGRGLAEVEVELFEAIEEMVTESGVRVAGLPSTIPVPFHDERFGAVVANNYSWLVWHPSFETLWEPRGVSASDSGGTVTISWTAPDQTTDLVTYVVRRMAGRVPVANPELGVDVAMGSPLDVSTTNAPGAGTWTYSVFAKYADPGGSVALHHSFFGYATVVVS